MSTKRRARGPFRRRRLEMRGDFAITDAALRAAEHLLVGYRGPEGDHEGIVYLLGTEQGATTLFSSALAPEANHGPGHVVCSADQVGAAAREARRYGLALLAQLHSHPGGWCEHSEGDDDLVLMPFEGMLSLVCPHYCHHGLLPLSSLGIHQFQDGRWELIEPEDVSSHFRVVPAEIDLR